MNLFDQLVTEALQQHTTEPMLRPVIEKELLHHDIIREMSRAGLLKDLTFMGGTCLRACYGAQRLSEDLDFTGGTDFVKKDLEALALTITTRLRTKYDLEVTVTEPTRDVGNTKTWKIKIETSPARKDLPSQRINIDICTIPSYQKKPMVLLNHYGIEMGTNGLIIQCESRDEILLDKVVAFALRPNRIKNRDLWDIAWLQQQGAKLPLELSSKKIADHNQEPHVFIEKLQARIHELSNNGDIEMAFNNEMSRFLPLDIVNNTLKQNGFWTYIITQISDVSKQVIEFLTGNEPISNQFPMG